MKLCLSISPNYQTRYAFVPRRFLGPHHSLVPREADSWVSCFKGKNILHRLIEGDNDWYPAEDTLQSMSASFPVYGPSLLVSRP